MTLKRQPGRRLRSASCSALRASAMEAPCIEPERSTTKTTSAAAAFASSRGRKETSAYAAPSAPRSTCTRGSCVSASAIRTTTSRSSAASRVDRLTVARPFSIVTASGCEGDSTERTGALVSTSSVRLRP